MTKEHTTNGSGMGKKHDAARKKTIK